MLGKVSVPKQHDSIGLLSLKQRSQHKLLNIMFIQANKGCSRKVTNINT